MFPCPGRGLLDPEVALTGATAGMEPPEAYCQGFRKAYTSSRGVCKMPRNWFSLRSCVKVIFQVQYYFFVENLAF